MKTLVTSLIVSAGLLASAGNAVASEALAKKYNCLTCHAMDKKVIGPAYVEVAAKYKGDAGAEAKLITKVKNGGAGAWGQVPMPPNAAVPDADIKTLVKWVLAAKK
ncbi:MAG: cytochrome C biogenesis protein CcsA [Proteobacteria bacterium]|nr:cytochrome C biogenesis protein CcsA [Pseudomonadota bacterium]